MPAAMKPNAAKARIKPTQPDRTRAPPPRAAPKANPKVTKILFIDIIVPRDSGACSRVKLTVVELLMLKIKKKM